MQESEVILLNNLSPADYDQLVEESVRYALLSLPFTVDRMNIPNEAQRALNIAKGKIAESFIAVFLQRQPH